AVGGGEVVRPLLDPPVDLQREEAREDLTTLVALATEERVELVLRQEHHAREGVVVESQELLDFLGGLPDAARQRAPLVTADVLLERDRRWPRPVDHPADPIAAVPRQELVVEASLLGARGEIGRASCREGGELGGTAQ